MTAYRRPTRLTEALALHARVIGQAGAVHGKGDRRATVSDWTSPS